MRKVLKKLLVISSWLLVFLLLPTTNSELTTIHAIVDPLSTSNNKFGIHIIQATPDESSPAASLVNSSGGDFGYITVLIESKDRNQGKWQEFFNDLRRRHLIPIVRLATQPENGLWKRPKNGEEEVWAEFLNSLNWPTKNRYVVIYNEPNQAQEWGGSTDAKSYAQVLDKTIKALRNKNEDFFVLNAGLDASAPEQPPTFKDEILFLKEMKEEVPGIFEQLDGWVSHSYPNPNFVGSPYALGRGTLATWIWEIQVLRSLGVNKDLPIFITETGWKHMEGLSSNPFLPSAETVADYYKLAFENIFSSNLIVAITPFLLTYQEAPFDHFSFKKVGSLGYYPQYQKILSLPKVLGKPVQENQAKLVKGEVYSSIVAGQNYSISLTFKNIGQSIWDGSTSLTTIEGGSQLGIQTVEIPKGITIEPGSEHTFTIDLKAPQKGSFKVSLNLFSGNNQFETSPLEFTTEVKQPVILHVISKLKWKDNPRGEYVLRVSGALGDSSQKVTLSAAGKSAELEARYLLPDYTFDFTLEKPYYKNANLRQNVHAGINVLDFGSLQPDIISTLFHPKELWKLLPFSN